jgi:hypothetical protein
MVKQKEVKVERAKDGSFWLIGIMGRREGADGTEFDMHYLHLGKDILTLVGQKEMRLFYASLE